MAKRIEEDPVPPLKTQQIIYNLTRSKAVLRRLLLSGDKDYASLVEKLLSLVGQSEIPTAKALQEMLGIKPPQLRRWLEACYAEVIDLLATDVDALQIKEVIHCLYFHGKRKTAEVRCRLSVTPRLHEYFELPLIGAETDEYTFYVSTITHEIELDKLLIHINLHAGYYDPYVALLKRRAYFEDKVSLQEMLKLSEYEIEEKLKELYG